MTRKEAVLNEVDQMPDEQLDKVLDFILRLKLAAVSESLETAYASEAVLARDWLSDEEEEAWRDL